MFGVGNYLGMGNGEYDPYAQGYYSSVPYFGVGGGSLAKHTPTSDSFVSHKKDDRSEKIIGLGALAIIIGAYILKGKVSMARLMRAKK